MSFQLVRRPRREKVRLAGEEGAASNARGSSNRGWRVSFFFFSLLPGSAARFTRVSLRSDWLNTGVSILIFLLHGMQALRPMNWRREKRWSGRVIDAPLIYAASRVIRDKVEERECPGLISACASFRGSLFFLRELKEKTVFFSFSRIETSKCLGEIEIAM